MPIVEAPEQFRRHFLVGEYRKHIPFVDFGVSHSLIGRGSHSEVYKIQDGLLFAADHNGHYSWKPWEAKLDYYYSKILRTIYPNYFPAIYAGLSGRTDGEAHTPGGTFREQIKYEEHDKGVDMSDTTLDLGDIDQLHQFGREPSGFLRYQLPTGMYEDFVEWANSGIPLVLDPAWYHFVKDKSGNTKYLDLPVRTPRLNLPWDVDKISVLMKKKGFSETEIQSIARIVGRVIRLEKVGVEIRDLVDELVYRRRRLGLKGKERVIKKQEEWSADEKKMALQALRFMLVPVE